jgi:hypothetical protein
VNYRRTGPAEQCRNDKAHTLAWRRRVTKGIVRAWRLPMASTQCASVCKAGDHFLLVR